jgi:hypothetical protein
MIFMENEESNPVEEYTGGISVRCSLNFPEGAGISA